jgi:hypothetical protein
VRLNNAIALLKKHGTNYREYTNGGSQHYAADVNGWIVTFWRHCTDPTMASACTIRQVGSDKACFSGRGIRTTVHRCVSGFYDRPRE